MRVDCFCDRVFIGTVHPVFLEGDGRDLVLDAYGIHQRDGVVIFDDLDSFRMLRGRKAVPLEGDEKGKEEGDRQ